MKPKVFIGSSFEQLQLAYAVQEELEGDAEPTVWTQGLFMPSRSVMESLFDALDTTDFAVFVLAPDDVVKLRDVEQKAVRDNVVFELGLFMGRVGRERTFMLVPRGSGDLRLPTDLAGLVPAEYEPNRQDANLVAAVGPACSRIKRAFGKYGRLAETPDTHVSPPPPQYDDNDIKSLLQSWMGSRRSDENTQAIRFSDVDAELSLPTGSTARHIEEVAKRWDYVPARRGAETILFEKTRGRGW